MKRVLAAAGVVLFAGVSAGQVPTPATPVRVDVGAPLTAALTGAPHLGPSPLAVRLRAEDSGPACVYLWDFGDGRRGSGREVEHTYTGLGNRTATLTVLRAGGATASARFTVTLSDGSYDLNGPVTANEARRFLWQAGFGPAAADVAAVSAAGYAGWMDAQRALPPTIIRAEDMATSIARGYGYGADSLWDDLAVQAPDQLRQRMAWALLQVLVMNDPQDSATADAAYYSGYLQRALGNYRELLGYIARSHQMGVYLTYIGNARADPATGSVPDENFAREVMQLFTIGLVMLGPDGTPVLDGAGRPIPTYDNATVGQFARVFTGFRWGSDYSGPMPMIAGNHEFGAKQLLNYPGAVPAGGLIPATNDRTEARAQADVDAALDNLFNHPNCGPFIAGLLIKRLTTSNPTPGYVGRVARAFEGTGPHGSGVRGDLFATARAILLDPEARDPAYRGNPQAGRVLEPLVARWGLYRALERVDRPAEAFPFRIAADGYQLQLDVGQSFMGSPSVFNFYLPHYIPPRTPLAPIGFFAPELQIYNDYTALATQNRFHDELVTRGGAGEAGRYGAWRALSADPHALVSALNDELMSGAMSPQAAAIIEGAVGRLSGATDRVRTAVWLTANSPEFRVLR